MRRTVEALLAVFVLVGCSGNTDSNEIIGEQAAEEPKLSEEPKPSDGCSDDSDSNERNGERSAGSAKSSDEGFDGDFKLREDVPPATKEEASWHDVGRRCLESASCMAWEECVTLTEPDQAVCASSCSTADDCVDLSGFPPPTFKAEVACKPFEGKNRCVLACEKDWECQKTQKCRDGVCVWPVKYPRGC